MTTKQAVWMLSLASLLCHAGFAVDSGCGHRLPAMAPSEAKPSHAKIISAKDLPALVAALRSQNKKIVATNGVFDLMHLGHMQYLEEARGLGDILVVAVNSDASVQRLKGPKRPILDQSTRAKQLAALQAVDYVVVFDDDTPRSVLEVVRPDVYVKGGDYQGKILPEAKLVEEQGGKALTLSFVDGISTTRIIEKIRSLYSAPTAPAPVAKKSVRSLSDTDLDKAMQAVSQERIVDVRPFPWRLGWFAKERKYLATTESGYKLLVKVEPSGRKEGPDLRVPLARYAEAVYGMARILGFSLVPPTARRRMRINGREVTVTAQLWVDKARPYSALLRNVFNSVFRSSGASPFARDAKKVSDATRRRDLMRLMVLDYLCNVHDRHGQNVMVDEQGRLVAIDNGYAFHPYTARKLIRPKIEGLELDEEMRSLLQSLDRAALKPLEGVLTEAELQTILERRDRLLSTSTAR